MVEGPAPHGRLPVPKSAMSGEVENAGQRGPRGKDE